MKIINETGLPYKIIGQVIDDVINRGEDETIYTGKIEAFTIDYFVMKINLLIIT